MKAIKHEMSNKTVIIQPNTSIVFYLIYSYRDFFKDFRLQWLLCHMAVLSYL